MDRLADLGPLGLIGAYAILGVIARILHEKVDTAEKEPGWQVEFWLCVMCFMGAPWLTVSLTFEWALKKVWKE